MQVINFKHEKDKTDIFQVHPILLMILFDCANEFYDRFKKTLTITATISDEETDKKLKRKSPAHLQKRAIDISVRNLDEYQIKVLLEYANGHPAYQQFHYLSQTGDYRLAYRHGVGDNDHIHMAIHSRFKR